MSEGTVDAVIVGAGQAGLAASHHMKQRGIDHVVLEKGRPGETWRTQRWDSFALNTPNMINDLPGMAFRPGDPVAFEGAPALAQYLEEYIETNGLPVQTGTSVTSAGRQGSDGLIEVKTSRETIATRNLVVASGTQNVPKLPGAARSVPDEVNSIHSADYKNPDSLPDGNVLVVGSAQSGVQVAEDLMDAGRNVYLSTSKVGRIRRRIRGRDIIEWLVKVGFFEHTVADLEDPNEQYARQPMTSGVDGGRTVSLQWLAQRGLTLLGGLDSVDGSTVTFRDNLRENIEFADKFSQRILERLNGAVDKMQPDAPELEEDPADDADPNVGVDAPTELDLRASGVTSIVWATGFGGNFHWLDVPGAVDAKGSPVHEGGLSPAEGVYFLGIPWQRTRGSGLIRGADADGAVVAEHIAGRM